MSLVYGRVFCRNTAAKLWRYDNIGASGRAIHLTGLSLRKGGAKLGADEPLRLPNLKSNEKR